MSCPVAMSRPLLVSSLPLGWEVHPLPQWLVGDMVDLYFKSRLLFKLLLSRRQKWWGRTMHFKYIIMRSKKVIEWYYLFSQRIRHIERHPCSIALLRRLTRIGVLVQFSVLPHDEEIRGEDLLELWNIWKGIYTLLKLLNLPEYMCQHLHLSCTSVSFTFLSSCLFFFFFLSWLLLFCLFFPPIF